MNHFKRKIEKMDIKLQERVKKGNKNKEKNILKEIKICLRFRRFRSLNIYLII